jgi:hypothetical protein
VPPANGRKRQDHEAGVRLLTKRHQPDQGGTHEGFLRLKDAYDRAMAAFRHATL